MSDSIKQAYDKYMAIVAKYDGKEENANAKRQLNKYSNILRRKCEAKGLSFMAVCNSFINTKLKVNT